MAERLEVRRLVYFRAAPQEVWRALSDPRLTKKYYFGMELRTNLKRGGEFSYGDQRGGKFGYVIRGRILEIRPRRKLVTTFAFMSRPKDPVSRVSYRLKRQGRLTELAFVHSRFGGKTITYRWVSAGWDWIFSALKTLLETGRRLR